MSKQTKLTWGKPSSNHHHPSVSSVPASTSTRLSSSSLPVSSTGSKRILKDTSQDDDEEEIIIVEEMPSKLPKLEEAAVSSSKPIVSSSALSSFSSSPSSSALSFLMKTAKENHYGDSFRMMHNYRDNTHSGIEGDVHWSFQRCSSSSSSVSSSSSSFTVIPVEIKFLEMVHPFRIRIETNNCPCPTTASSSSSSSRSLLSSLASSMTTVPYSSLASVATITLSPSMWKSSLQKCVRRGNVVSALRIGKEMWYRDPVDLVRRLMIIIIEDSILHPAYPFLAWLLLLSSAITDHSFSLCIHHYGSIVLHILNEITVCKVQDKSSLWESELNYYELLLSKLTTLSTSSTLSNDNVTKRLKTDPTESLSPLIPSESFKPVPWLTKDYDLYRNADEYLSAPYGIYIKSLLIRKRFGGMTFDTHMLQQASAVWFYRFWCDRNAQHFPSVLYQEYTVFRSRLLALRYVSLSWYELLHRIHHRTVPKTLITAPISPSSGYYVYASPFTSMNAVPQVTRTDIPLEGIDFHCSNLYEFLTDVLHNKFIPPSSSSVSSLLTDSVSLATFRQVLTELYHQQNQSSLSLLEKCLHTLIWNYRSSLNYRERLNGELPDPLPITSLSSSSISSSSSTDSDSSRILYPYFLRLQPYVDAWCAYIIQQRFH